jgi:hypothetical protein
MRRRALVVLAAGFLAGCAARPPMTITQLNALEIRDIDAGPPAVFDAVSNAVIDAGYTVEVTDAEGGLLSAVRREDPSVAEHAAVLTITTLLSLGHAPMTAQPRFFAVCAQVSPRPGGLASVRIRAFNPDGSAGDPKVVEEIWGLTQRRILMGLPPPGP